MTLTINILYKGKDSKKFAKEMTEKGIVERIRAQKGNIRYEYYQSLERDDEILLLDIWENQEALNIHHQSPMMDEIIKLREKYDIRMQVHKYQEIEGSNDDKYIRK
ncbi:antibiotic biosynthesis monooxygenase [Anaerococcus sp. NML200537]|uniref:putative quinol monooxygenase n=1 Tax=Anaerococcus sp. NML200537 TaxID=2954485 RepID=UPI002238B20A|nr:putative quinol monooxygenase [Anaerococcus sp. NML200537]MCW6701463.1 antibiotic biosynthesis monooxygenase [Anaerococcus sp. NML200537]